MARLIQVDLIHTESALKAKPEVGASINQFSSKSTNDLDIDPGVRYACKVIPMVLSVARVASKHKYQQFEMRQYIYSSNQLPFWNGEHNS